MKTLNDLSRTFTKVRDLQKKLNIDEGLLKQALLHRSYLNESKEYKTSNERLEFLGDAVLELVVSEFLYKNYPQKSEGQLTKLRSKIVCTKTLSFLARKLFLGKLLFLSKGEEASGGRENQTLLANTFEAVIGALYLGKGKKAVENFLKKILFAQLDKVLESSSPEDFKSQFQEIVQAREQPTPVYKLISTSGPDHKKKFKVAAIVNEKIIATGTGPSKQKAEQEAARTALEKIREKD